MLGSICALLLLTVVSNEIMIITIPNPSIATYKSLKTIYSTALRCPCSNKTIPHQLFMSFSPTFHQICSSGFVHDVWITTLEHTANYFVRSDWRNKAFTQFQILSDLCQLSNKTIHDAVDRFLSQVFIASSMMNELDFHQQLNTSVNQFYQSALYNFDLQKDILQLIMQVNQFYTGTFAGDPEYFNTGLLIEMLINETNSNQTIQVCLFSE